MTQEENKKKKAPKVSDARFTVDLHFRVTDEEYRFIESKASEIGCNVSQAARMILFKKMNTSVENLSDGQEKRSRLLAVRGIRDEFKRIANRYDEFVGSYVRSVGMTNEDGYPVVSTDMTLRMVKTVESMTIALQGKLNELFREEDVKEEHWVTRSGRLAGMKEIRVEITYEELVKYYYMERIMIIGKLTEDASSYKSEKGHDKIRMKVACEGIGKNGAKVARTYNVFSRDTEALALMKKGKSVFVEGSFTQDEKKENLVFADVLKFADE